MKPKITSPFKPSQALSYKPFMSGSKDEAFTFQQSPSSRSGAQDENVPLNATPVLNSFDPLTPIYSDQEGNVIAIKKYSPPLITRIEKEKLDEIEGNKKRSIHAKTQTDDIKNQQQLVAARPIPLTNVSSKRQSSVTARLGEDDQGLLSDQVSCVNPTEDYKDATHPSEQNIVVRSTAM